MIREQSPQNKKALNSLSLTLMAKAFSKDKNGIDVVYRLLSNELLCSQSLVLISGSF